MKTVLPRATPPRGFTTRDDARGVRGNEQKRRRRRRLTLRANRIEFHSFIHSFIHSSIHIQSIDRVARPSHQSPPARRPRFINNRFFCLAPNLFFGFGSPNRRLARSNKITFTARNPTTTIVTVSTIVTAVLESPILARPRPLGRSKRARTRTTRDEMPRSRELYSMRIDSFIRAVVTTRARARLVNAQRWRDVRFASSRRSIRALRTRERERLPAPIAVIIIIESNRIESNRSRRRRSSWRRNNTKRRRSRSRIIC